MKRFGMALALFGALLVSLAAATAMAQQQPTVSIAADLDPNSNTGIAIEGLVSDNNGILYTSDTASKRLFRINPSTGAVDVLGTLPKSATGMAFDAAGNLYLASSDSILRIDGRVLGTSQVATTDVTTFATGVTGANGLAFGPGTNNLYVSGGATGNIYLVARDGMTQTFASGFTSERSDQQISTNGLAFGPDQKLYSSNTGTGAIDKITLKADGTLDRVDRFVKDPLLLGADGITFASNGDLYVAANERNAIVKVTQAGVVSDVTSNGNSGPLEFPASPSFSGNALYASNFDIARGANSPNTPGVGGSIARIEVGISGATLPAPATQATQVPVTTTVTPQGTTVEATATAQPTAPQPTAVATTPAASTPTIEATVISTPVAEATATEVVVAPVGETPVVEGTPITPGMPTTGNPGGPGTPMFLLLIAVAGTLAVIAGAMLTRAKQS